MDDVLKRMYQDRAWYASQLDTLDEAVGQHEVDCLWAKINYIDEQIQHYYQTGHTDPYSGY
jgi:hypothetical protein